MLNKEGDKILVTYLCFINSDEKKHENILISSNSQKSLKNDQ